MKPLAAVTSMVAPLGMAGLERGDVMPVIGRRAVIYNGNVGRMGL